MSELVNVKILDKDYRVSCDAEGREDLQRAARYLDQQMRDIRSSGNIIGVERIAIMAALNIAHEYLQQDCESSGRRSEMDNRLRHIQQKIEIALNQNSQLEL
ncbi:cell division protein ZapA [Magnetovirga frankeli]|uniref:cell division protein ZapA n=1 Tax=Magnetovirga frankeli TaxID=947516 RepID=UPI001293C2AB|nr:cell division protein ZapA [gamma proteobacterium SS-5]